MACLRPEPEATPMPRLCKNKCGRDCVPPYDTCCRRCATNQNGHDISCEARQGHVLLTQVIKAELTKNFSSFGTMDPFAVVEFADEDGKAMKEIARTPTDWGGNQNPVWNYKCLGQPYELRNSPSNDCSQKNLKFSVFERPFADFSSPIFCGSALVPLAQLLENATAASSSTSVAQPHALQLLNAGENIGTISVQVMLVKKANETSTSKSVTDLTHVDATMFEKPVARLPVSGGTAPFFQLMLTAGKEKDGSQRYYIGKDLSHTQDEVLFYEEALALAGQPHASDLKPVLKFMFEYAGIFTSPEKDAKPDAKPLDLLVLRNLFDGCTKLRMLDIKIGQKTASADWYGKSRAKALIRGVTDGFTNSGYEGFRLAGFNGQPPSFTSRDPLLNIPPQLNNLQVKTLQTGKDVAMKKMLSAVYSTMQGAEMFSYFLDVHQIPKDLGATGLAQSFTPSELVEVALHEIVHKLVLLAVSCRHVHVPQKWVGSSVCLAFDCGHLPPRKDAEMEVRKGVRVHIFDWGRSELNTVEKHMKLTEKEQHDRNLYWRYYTGGIDRLAWEALRAYSHRFGNASSWGKTIKFTICDFESLAMEDFLGTVEVPLEPTTNGPCTVPLDPNSPDAATLTYSIEQRHYPKDARLKMAWRITVHRATKLTLHSKTKKLITAISSNQITLSDPYVRLTVVSDDGQYTFRQCSAIIPKCADPEWNEEFEVPVVSAPHRLGEALARAEPMLANAAKDLKLPAEGGNASNDEASLAEWVKCLNSVVRAPADGVKNNPTSSYISKTLKIEGAKVANALGELFKRANPKSSS